LHILSGPVISAERNDQHRKFDHILYRNFLLHFLGERESRSCGVVVACTYFNFINLISLGVRCEYIYIYIYIYIFIALLDGPRDDWNVKGGFSYFTGHQSSEDLIFLALNSMLYKTWNHSKVQDTKNALKFWILTQKLIIKPIHDQDRLGPNLLH